MARAGLGHGKAVSVRNRIWSFAAPLLLALIVVTIAAAVNEFAAPPGGLQLAKPDRTGFGSAVVGTGSVAYPRVATDCDGLRVTISAPAKRIVSQSRPIEELLYAVVPPDRVVGVSATAYDAPTSDVYPYVEKYRPAIASDLERTLRLDPDLIIVSSSGRAELSSLLRSTGRPVFRMYTMFNTLDQVAESIRLTGYLTGEDQAARQEEERFRAELNRAFAMRPASGLKPRVLAWSMGIVYGHDTLFNDIAEKIGAINVGAEAGLKGYEQVNSESVLKWNPEWIVTGADPDKAADVRARILSDPAIALTRAAHDGHIIVLDNRVFLPVSQYSARLAVELAQALYGDRR